MQTLERIQKAAAYGNSIGFRLTKSMCEISQIVNGSKCKIYAEPNKVIITRLPEINHRTIKERFANYKGNYCGESLEWGDDIGGEKF